MKRLSLIVVLCLAATAARGEDAYEVRRTVLPNGLQVWVKPRPTTHVVDVRVVVKVGFRYERAEDSGISHLLEHMMFKGTAKHSEIELDRIIDATGAYSNGETWPEMTFYQVNIIDRDFPLALDWLREILLESLLRENEMNQAREDVYSEQGGDYPSIVESIFERGWFQPIELRVADTLFPEARLADRAIARLDRFHPEDLRSFYRRYYVPNNMAVIIVGNVDPDDALRRVEAAFGAMRPAAVRARDYFRPRAPRIPQGEIETKLMPPAGQMTEVWRGIITRGRTDPDRYVLRVIERFVSRRAYEEVRSKRALAYDVGCRMQELSDVGALYAWAQPRRKTADEEKTKLILQEIFDRLQRAPITDAELHDAKESLTGRLARSYESNANLGGLYQELFLTIPAREPLPDAIAAIDGVTKQDVLRVARARFASGVFRARARPALSYTEAIIAIVTAGVAIAVAVLAMIRRRRPSV